MSQTIKVTMTNNSQVPLNVDLVGNNLPENIMILGVKQSATKEIAEDRVVTLKSELGKRLLINRS